MNTREVYFRHFLFHVHHEYLIPGYLVSKKLCFILVKWSCDSSYLDRRYSYIYSEISTISKKLGDTAVKN